jgi:hypothetical protein
LKTGISILEIAVDSRGVRGFFVLFLFGLSKTRFVFVPKLSNSDVVIEFFDAAKQYPSKSLHICKILGPFTFLSSFECDNVSEKFPALSF